jgi:hypothetical protein
MASVLSVDVGSASHCGVGHDRCGRCSGLSSLSRLGLSQPLWWRARQARAVTGLRSLGRHGLSQPLWWRKRQVMALLWPLFDLSGWAQSVPVVAGTSVEGAALATVRSVDVGSDSHCDGGHDMYGRCSGLFSLGLRWINQEVCWRTLQLRALRKPLLARATWAQPATVVAGTSVKGASLNSGSISRLGLSQTLWWRARVVRAVLLHLFATLAWAQPAIVVAGTTGEGVALASVRLVGVGPESHCGGRQYR